MDATNEVVRLNPNAQKIVHAIAYVIHLADGNPRKLTQYDIVKSMFFADRAHLNQWGRPVTYDNYCAMRHGPVPSLTYDFLKENRRAMEKHGFPSLPWRRTKGEKGGKDYFSNAVIDDFDDVLSPSDQEALQQGLNIVTGSGFSQIRKLTHRDRAYVDAWKGGDDGNGSYPMDIALLLDTPDSDRILEIQEVSENV